MHQSVLIFLLKLKLFHQYLMQLLFFFWFDHAYFFSDFSILSLAPFTLTSLWQSYRSLNSSFFFNLTWSKIIFCRLYSISFFFFFFFLFYFFCFFFFLFFFFIFFFFFFFFFVISFFSACFLFLFFFFLLYFLICFVLFSYQVFSQFPCFLMLFF